MRRGARLRLPPKSIRTVSNGHCFQKFLNRVGRTYGQADKTLFGGLLPGGAASAASPVKQKAQETAVNTGKVLAGAAMNQLPDRAELDLLVTLLVLEIQIFN
jgi:hypothetical protein